MQAVRKSLNHDLIVDAAWRINPGKMESRPGDFPGLRRLRAGANFAVQGHRREGRPDLPVSLLMVLHALRLECEKSIELTASSHRS